MTELTAPPSSTPAPEPTPSSSGAAVTPSPTPSPSPSPTPSSPAAPTTSPGRAERAPFPKTDFGALTSEVDGTAPVAPAPAAQTIASGPTAAPVVAPVIAPVAQPQVQAPVPPVPPPVAQPALQAQVQPDPVASQGQPTPQQQMTAWREQAVNHLTQRYAMTPEMEQEFMVNPGKVVPMLAANLQVALLEDVSNMVMRQLPGLISQIGQQSRQSGEAEQAFFTKWPKLKEHRSEVEQALVAYRSVNPKATFQELVERVGMLVHMTKGIPFDAPGMQPAPIMAPVAVQQAFVPAQPGGGGGALPAANQGGDGNFFSALANEMLHDRR